MGRITSKASLNIDLNKEDIEFNIKRCLYDEEFKKSVFNANNPYEKEGTSDSILIIIKDILNKNKINLQKKFFDL